VPEAAGSASEIAGLVHVKNSQTAAGVALVFGYEVRHQHDLVAFSKIKRSFFGAQPNVSKVGEAGVGIGYGGMHHIFGDCEVSHAELGVSVMPAIDSPAERHTLILRQCGRNDQKESEYYDGQDCEQRFAHQIFLPFDNSET
jgi:hypothetical protein